MNRKKVVVILYSKGMNDNAAELIANEINERDINVSAVAISDAEYMPNGMGKLRFNWYKVNVANFALANRVYFGIYRAFTFTRRKRKKRIKNIKDEKIVAKIRKTRLNNIFYRFEPSLIICASVGSLRQALKAREELGFSTTKIFSLITDYMFDKEFYDRRVDGYLVQNEGIRRSLIKLLDDDSIVEVVGTPIANIILKEHDKNELLEKHDISPEKPVFLISAGRYSSTVLKKLAVKIAKDRPDINFIVNASESDSTTRFLQAYCRGSDLSNVYIIRGKKDMDEIYSIIDYAIVAPTALTTYELSVRKIPFILIDSSNYVEKNNGEYLASKVIGLYPNTYDDLLMAIDIFTDEREMVTHIRANQREITTLNATDLIANKAINVARRVIVKKREEE